MNRVPDELLQEILAIARRVPSSQIASISRSLMEFPSERATEIATASIADPSMRSKLEQLITLWGDRAVPGGLAALGWALASAGDMDDWHRRFTRAELVWSGPSPPSSRLRRTEQAILEVIGNAREELWLVSFAAYRVPSIRDALLGAAKRRVRIGLIIESAKESEGKVAFSALEGIGRELAEVATVYVWPLEQRSRNHEGKFGSLHVKCTLGDRQQLFVTSANLTDFAMSLNMELGLLVTGGPLPQMVDAQLNWLIEGGHLVPTRNG